MEELKIKYDQLQKGLKQLDRMLFKYQRSFQNLSIRKTEETEDEYMTHRDALIKRFEFCYDLTWKYLKTLLKAQHSIDANSPRKVFQDSFTQDIVSESEMRVFLTMIDARNETAHVYDELRADEVGKKIAGFVGAIKQLVDRCVQYQ